MKHRRMYAWLGCVLILVGLLAFSCWFMGLVVNTTRSIPLGLYVKTRGSPSVGAYVMVCPPQNRTFFEAKQRGYLGAGYCPGGFGYMLKKILAAKNDVVSVNKGGVTVNGLLLMNSAPVAQDGAGRTMPIVALDGHRLLSNELLLMGTQSRQSFDGRYYGLIDARQVVSVIQPVFVF